jgi:hypothetical protein
MPDPTFCPRCYCNGRSPCPFSPLPAVPVSGIRLAAAT